MGISRYLSLFSGLALLAGFTIPPQYFRQNNPASFNAIAHQANRLYYQLPTLPDGPGLVGLALRLLMKLVP